MRRLFLASLLALALPLGAQAQMVEVGKAKFEPTVDVGGTKLVINGAGIRSRGGFIKVYAVAMYLPQKATTPEAVLAQAGAKRVSLHMLRDVDGKELGKAFTEAMQKNMLAEDRAKSINGVFKFGEVFSERKKLASGDVVNVDWVPNVGAQVFVDGKPVGDVIKEPEFYGSLLRIWMGANPPSEELKAELLGKKR